MSSSDFGDYNREQRASFEAIRSACEGLSAMETEALRKSMLPYLRFREELERFQVEFFGTACRSACFDTGLSACCGFESIYTFFADQAISWLFSSEEERSALLRAIERPNRTRHCVYLGAGGCIWKVRPVSCAMFLCERVRKEVFEKHSGALRHWEDLQRREKDFTRPDKPVLFDDVEKVFMGLGVDSPHMYCHKSPGLLRIKVKAGRQAITAESGGI
ncbi:MAG: hypothetical protein ABFD98_10120 [Syntrophobacteraceae bacterium]|nr:hypothetical protein [Desulfobacteraceae bacterium]